MLGYSLDLVWLCLLISGYVFTIKINTGDFSVNRATATSNYTYMSRKLRLVIIDGKQEELTRYKRDR